MQGVVVNRLTGAPVGAVTIHLCGSDGDVALGWNGVWTDEEGHFDAELPDDWRTAAQLRLEVVAGCDGYRSARVAVTTANVRVELEKLEHPLRPGRFIGTAIGEDGKPLGGRLLVQMWDELDLASSKTWTTADSNGRFAIHGVPPGHWTLGLAESIDKFEANIVEGEEARVELRAKFAGPHPGAFAPGELTEATYKQQRVRIASEPRTQDDQGASTEWLLQQLELQWLRYSPGRDLIVTGLPTLDGAFVRLAHREGAGCDWRAAISDGKALFPSIPLGKWTAVLVRPGEPDVSVDVETVKGEGALTIDLPVTR